MIESGPDNLLDVNEFMSVAELANMMDRKPAELIAKLFEMGMMATINQRLDMDTIEMVAGEFGFEVQEIAEIGEMAAEVESEENLESRAPIVTVMGHVDHGKTSLLDYIRKTNVVAGEAGAITQHIGAYEVRLDRGSITFLDTPGHEAFTAMRARGSQVTDIVILVVAADDGVRPQTIEAIDHARAAGAPIIVAINKIDKPTANPDSVLTQLSNHNLLSEDWGGKTIMVNVSAKTGEGMDKLLEMVLLQAEMMDLQADASIRGSGVVIESKLEKGRGPVATVLIQRGTCFVGDSIVSGVHFGRVRTMTNDRAEDQTEAGPAKPVQVTGLNGVPQAGDSFMAVASDQEAREISSKRSQVKREQDFRRPQGAITLDKVFDRIREGQIKEVRLVIKGDVQGSVEVLSDTLGKIQTDEVKTNIIRSGVGAITESDVLLAAASDAIIIGFHVTPQARAREVAKTEKVDIRLYEIIYEAEDDVKKALEGLLSPDLSEEFVGSAEVRETFRVPKIGVIAGSYVKSGRINRKDKVRLVRDGKPVYEGTLKSLKRFKDDTREVKEGYECGIGLENFDDIKVGDLIESFEIVETARTLE
jgi:translation initiation factor IF-2